MATNIYHITWVTHNSRESERMRKYKVIKGYPTILNNEEETEIAEYTAEIVQNDKLIIFAFNICRDHVHILITCEDGLRDSIVNKMKAVSSRMFNIAHKKTVPGAEQGGMPPCSESFPRRGKTQTKLWAQKYNWSLITNEEQLASTYEYVKHNRLKHNLSRNEKLERVIERMLTPYENIFI